MFRNRLTRAEKKLIAQAVRNAHADYEQDINTLSARRGHSPGRDVLLGFKVTGDLVRKLERKWHL